MEIVSSLFLAGELKGRDYYNTLLTSQGIKNTKEDLAWPTG